MPLVDYYACLACWTPCDQGSDGQQSLTFEGFRIVFFVYGNMWLYDRTNMVAARPALQALKWHPDKHPEDEEEAERQFRQVFVGIA
eukprot:5907111-Amphidinium_carterae.1